MARFPWILHALFLAAFAYLGARTVNLFTAQAIRPPLRLVASSTPSAAKAVAHAELTAEAFAKMMGMQIPETQPEAAIDDTSAPGEASRPADLSSEPVRTSLHAQLLATVIANRAEWSIATLRDLNQNIDDVYMIDDKFMGAQVLEIQQLRVILLNDGHREFLDLSAPTAVAIVPKPTDALPSATGEGIKKLDEHHYNIERSTVNNALTNLNDLAMQARIVPSFKNGQANGFKLFSIRPDSLYSKIGIQNGDVIQGINGLDINSPDKALEAYGKLKSANALDLKVERNGQSVNYHYAIQ